MEPLDILGWRNCMRIRSLANVALIPESLQYTEKTISKGNIC